MPYVTFAFHQDTNVFVIEIIFCSVDCTLKAVGDRRSKQKLKPYCLGLEFHHFVHSEASNCFYLQDRVEGALFVFKANLGRSEL